MVLLPQEFQLLTEPRRLGLGLGSSGDGRIQLALQLGGPPQTLWTFRLDRHEALQPGEGVSSPVGADLAEALRGVTWDVWWGAPAERRA